MPSAPDTIDEAARRRFEADWQTGSPPEIDSYLPSADADSYLQTLVELVCIDLELRWKLYARSGAEPLGVAEYLRRYPALIEEHDALLRQEAEHSRGRRAPRIPECEIVRELGRGGMGVVYLANQSALNRRVAVKTLRHVAGAPGQELQRFYHEAEAVARLAHPNIVPIFHIGRDAETPYFLMEYVDGGTLADRLKSRPLPPEEAAALVEILARATESAHQRGIIHRDLKPSNILLAADGTPKISDFGLAKTLGLDSKMTQTGNVLGTPSYMAPEQATGSSSLIATQTDVYALGAILYECLTGRPPFQADTMLATLEEVCHREPVPPSKLRAGISRDLETICLQCLSKDPAKRYARAELLADDLNRVLHHKPVLARRVGTWGVFTRWCRRNPGLGATLAASIALVTAIASVAVWNVLAERDKFRSERDRAEANLYRSLVAQAAGHLDSRGPEWWWKATESLAAAAQLDCPERNPDELRDLYVRCLGSYYHSLRVKSTWAEPGEPVLNVALSGDGKLAAIARRNGRIEIRNPVDGGLVHVVVESGERVAALVFDPTKPEIHYAIKDRLFRSSVSKSPDVSWHSTAGEITTLAVPADGGKLLIGTADGTVVAMALDAALTITPVRKRDHRITGLAALPAGGAITIADESKALINCTADGARDHWNHTTHNPAVNLRMVAHFVIHIDPLSFGYSWTNSLVQHHQNYHHIHDNAVRRVFFIRGGALSASHDGTLRICGSEASKPFAQFTRSQADFGPITDAEILPDESAVLVAYADGSVRLWEIFVPPERTFFGNATQSVCFVGPRHEAFDGFNIGAVPYYGVHRTVADKHPDRIWTVASSVDGRWLASGDHSGYVKIWNPDTGKAEQAFRDFETLVWSVAFRNEPCWLAYASGPIAIRDAASGAKVMELSGHERLTCAMVFHPKLPLLVSAGRDKSVRLWDLETKSMIAELSLDTIANSLAIDPDGTTLAAACDDSKVLLWTVSTMDEARSFAKPARILDGHATPVRAVAFSHDGVLASGAEQGVVILRDMRKDFRTLVRMRSCAGQVRSLQFSGDDRFLILGNYVGTAVVWDLPAVRKSLAAVGLDWRR